MKLLVKKLTPDATLPSRKHASDAGLDLYAAESVEIRPGEIVRVRTGISVQLENSPGDPFTHNVLLVWDKSSMGARGLKVLGGVVDAGYTGEVFVWLANVNTFGVYNGAAWDVPSFINRGTVTIGKFDKIAQLIIQRYSVVDVEEVKEHAQTDRGDASGGASVSLS